MSPPTAGAAPLPAALPLFASGRDVMGFFAKRRKRKNRASSWGKMKWREFITFLGGAAGSLAARGAGARARRPISLMFNAFGKKIDPFVLKKYSGARLSEFRGRVEFVHFRLIAVCQPPIQNVIHHRS